MHSDRSKSIMRKQDTLRILAIDPGTRLTGAALLDGNSLIYHGVKVVAKGLCPDQTLRRGRDAFVQLVEDFRPNLIVAERPFFGPNRNASLLNVLVDEMRSVARRRGIAFATYAPSTIKKHICGNGRADKRQVACVVVSHFPELKVYLTQDRAWKERFHCNMFDAVALAITARDSGR